VVVAIFDRESVGAEIACDDIDRMLPAERAGDAQHFALGLDIEAIARFDLDGGDAFGEQACEPGRRPFQQLLFSRGAGGADRREDAAARLGNLGIGNAIEALLEFLGAVAAVDNVGMAVDQARGEEAPAAIDGLTGRCVLARSGPSDATAFHQNGAVLDQAIRPSVGHGRQLEVGKKHLNLLV
jgi:hypothetical protein